MQAAVLRDQYLVFVSSQQRCGEVGDLYDRLLTIESAIWSFDQIRDDVGIAPEREFHRLAEATVANAALLIEIVTSELQYRLNSEGPHV